MMSRERTRSIEYSLLARTHSPSHFDFYFLRWHAGYKIRCIWKLAFDASLEYRSRTRIRFMNIQGIDQLAAMLWRNRHKLTSLKWVQVFGHLGRVRAVDSMYADCPEVLFVWVDPRGDVRRLEKRLIGEEMPGFFKGWNVERGVDTIPSFRRTCHVCTTASLTFTKGDMGSVAART